MRGVFIGLFILLGLIGHSQSSIKLKKQKHTFYYTQMNFHAGYINDLNGPRWDVTNRAPVNQIAFQVFNKNQKLLQKGYTESIALESFKVRLSLGYYKSVNSLGLEEAELKFKFLDAWLKFKTKWDRTNIWVGNKSIPYGHNPKIDPLSSFMTNLIKMDLGFAQDLGIFLKTPINNRMDLEISLTSGGALNKPLLICENLIDNSVQQDLKPKVRASNFNYNGTWLITTRAGQPSYNKNEIGIIAVAGYIPSTTNANDFNHIYRLGFDWVTKYYEKLKNSFQFTGGSIHSDQQGSFGSLNLQNSMDLYIHPKFILSSSYAFNFLKSPIRSNSKFNHTWNSSLTYVISPHTRLRLNYYNTEILEAGEKQWGMLMQFVTGFGKRN